MTAGVLAGYRVGFRPCSYDAKVFSPRIRAVLPARALARAGLRAEIVPPAGDDDFDCVVFQKAYGKADRELALKLRDRGKRVVVDLCDNHFYNPSGDPELGERAARLQAMIDLADVVSVSTPSIGELVQGKPTVVVDDALELLRGTDLARRLGERLRPRLPGGRVRLVWHGQVGTENPPSGMIHLKRLVPELEELNRSLPLSLTVISNSRTAFRAYVGRPTFPARFLTWRPPTFPFLFAAHDVYVLPIDANPFTICKTNNKVVASLMLGVPVVADAIPSYQELADWVLFGEWASHIRAYAEDAGLVRRHTQGAQDYVRRVYTDDHVVAQWSDVLVAAFA